jgi:imidazolonepropionase-like amidohydrolase
LSSLRATNLSESYAALTLTNRGLIKQIGVNLDTKVYGKIAKVDARGAWVTPGIFDMHSHLGVDSVRQALISS